MKTLVLVICCVGDEHSENFFFTPDNEKSVIHLVLRVKISILSYTVLIWTWLCHASCSQHKKTVTWCWN